MNRARSLKSLVFVALCDKSREARVGRCEIVAGAGNPWICGCELAADVSWNAAAGCVGRVARVARAALCHGDCCWASRVGVAVPWGLVGGLSSRWRRVLGIADHVVGGAVSWGLVTRASSGWRCVIGIADQGIVWVAPCHWDC